MAPFGHDLWVNVVFLLIYIYIYISSYVIAISHDLSKIDKIDTDGGCTGISFFLVDRHFLKLPTLIWSISIIYHEHIRYVS